MSGFKGMMKEGWHPKGKDGGKESWRGDFKGINQVAGWMGKGRDPNEAKGSEHVSRPLASLKDPASFGPPPKNVNYHGGAALPDRITPDRRGLGAPLSQQQLSSSQRTVTAPPEEEQSSRPPPPPVPYRANTTGLKTDHLPPPPVHRAIQDVSPQNTGGSQSSKPKPSLPPRLPSRTASNEPVPSSPPPAYEPVQSPSPVSLPPPLSPPAQSSSNSSGYLNQGAVGRLGKAGISVPGLGIGEKNPWEGEKSQSTTRSQQSNGSQINELQSRFAKMNSSSTTPSSSPSQGTTWSEKQTALQTAQSFHKDPSSISAQDARQAATTANNFRERHGDQIRAGASRASGLNKKYNLTGRMNSFLEQQSSPSSEQQTSSAAPAQQNQSPEAQALSQRKPPPPPPPKKPANMTTHPSNGTQSPAPPPPVPMGTKPR